MAIRAIHPPSRRFDILFNSNSSASQGQAIDATFRLIARCVRQRRKKDARKGQDGYPTTSSNLGFTIVDRLDILRKRLFEPWPFRPKIGEQAISRYDIQGTQREFGGGGGIRTHGARKGSPVFKTGALDHSATPPRVVPAFERFKPAKHACDCRMTSRHDLPRRQDESRERAYFV